MTNILDKSDKSVAPIPPRGNSSPAGCSKRLKFDWSQGSQPGTFMMLPKQQLNIDGRYQRDSVSETKVLQIARRWDWMLIGVVIVVRRSDGTFWVVDGGHRTRASFYRDDVTEMPCMVYELDAVSDEAKAFLGKNLMVTNVSSVDKHKAAVCAEDDTALIAAKILDSLGIEVANAATTFNQLKCINTFTNMVRVDQALARRVLVFVLQQTEGKAASSIVLRGIFALCIRLRDRVDVLSKYGDKLARHSQKEMEVRIRQMRAECGKGGEKVEALAMLSLINKGSRKKLEW